MVYRTILEEAPKSSFASKPIYFIGENRNYAINRKQVEEIIISQEDRYYEVLIKDLLSATS